MEDNPTVILDRNLVRRRVLMGLGIAAAVCVIVIIIVIGYWFPLTGFSAYETPKSNKVDYYPGKTLWDWLDLLVVPFVLVLGGFLLNRSGRENDNAIAERRAKTDRQIATAQQHEAALQEYLDKMSSLLLDKQLASSKEDDLVQCVARARTLTVLGRLGNDGARKESLVRFLYEADLISTESKIIDLAKANLSELNLTGENLSKVNLVRAKLVGAQFAQANLRYADLSYAYLSQAVMTRADLSNADLTGADLKGANLKKANLSWANLRGARPIKADLTGARLVRANMRGARLNEATLVAADLRGADLRGAILRGADLSEADLGGAKGTDIEWKQARSLKGATMPDGTKHE